ncbi:hypothetical protein GCM10022276_10550 [Sphingomonas limnosediminicola]|uniref:Glucosamine inositolphosphorylceramide transferase 1 N-terminal domain-containing protein n=2 Tax=Sphingomonas limnosediminicola TaxID=940133 RepID=A0ABP7L354_9SPHN
MYERCVLENIPANKRVSLPEDIANLPTVQCVPLKVGKYRQRFDDASVRALREYDVDVLLRFGFGILTGEILTLPKYGLWSFHHGDPEHYRGAPPGFWEIHNKEPVTGVVLQRLTEKLDGGIVLHSGWFKTNIASYPRSLNRTLMGSAHFVARALIDLRRDPSALVDRPCVALCGQIYRYPRTIAVFEMLMVSVRARVFELCRSLFSHQQWAIGFVQKTPEKLLEEAGEAATPIQGVSWLPEPAGRFLADPFAVDGDSGVILAEEFDWKTGRGHIASIRSDISDPIDSRSAVREDFHLSYPYTFEHQGEIYCVPESAENNEVALYILNQSTGTWVKHKSLLSGCAVLDPTIFSHEGRWWLFCTKSGAGANEALYAWHAEDPLGDWHPHTANPLKVDVRSARPAGRPFVHDGHLIRPAQDCSTGYGNGICFNRITRITTDEFAENFAGLLLPETGTYGRGLHTICAAGPRSIVDGARSVFIGAEFCRVLRKKFGGSV